MDNGNKPAFPSEYVKGDHVGVTKRELAAFMAMQGILAGLWSNEKMIGAFIKAAKDEGNTYREELKERSFLIADAMIEAQS